MQNIQVNSSPLVNGDLGSLTLKRLGNLLTAWMQMDYSVKQSDIEQKLVGNSTGRKVLAGRCWTMRRCGCLTWTKGICLFLWWTNQMEQGWISGQGLGFILPLTFVFLVNVNFGQCHPKRAAFATAWCPWSLTHFQMCSVKLKCGVNIPTKWRREMSGTGSLGPSIPSLHSQVRHVSPSLWTLHVT